MPQLDKVTFLSQFFWFCVVFFGMYLILVKFFLPALARIVKVRQVLSNTGSAESTQSGGSSTRQFATYNSSLEASLGSFQRYMDFLSRWNATQLDSILPKISPDYISKHNDLRASSLAVEAYINNIVPPVGRSQNPVFESEAHKYMFTNAICDAIEHNDKSEKPAAKNKKGAVKGKQAANSKADDKPKAAAKKGQAKKKSKASKK